MDAAMVKIGAKQGQYLGLCRQEPGLFQGRWVEFGLESLVS